jgi:hypothetical protein
MVVGFTTNVHSVPISTKVVSWNPIHGEIYSIQHSVITFVSNLRQVGGFLIVMTEKELSTVSKNWNSSSTQPKILDKVSIWQSE